ncbi:hypothetical protein M8J71_16255 [Pseudarthrobacter sp. R1]|uniref:hypothetical protein n=1 Tax=Pseudarthrobacter sp. R1 TaxID=2944934 RepID=UPI00210B4508|nr:hypothetical protein [Pseudarthrobacter sp. R1]MCQ6272024.1 hypothetical protein [Pseudarthrobacter sp. R1]
MTATGIQAGSEELVPGPDSAYDLVICHDDRIVFHDHYPSPAFRLRMCAQLLTASDVVLGAIDASAANEVHELYQSSSGQWESAPDSVVNAIAKLCRRWGVQVYVSTTRKKTEVPAALYSVITEYGPGQTVAEHFTSREARRASLIERADMFFSSRGSIPERVLADEQRLAALVGAFLMPATVLLTEALLDEADGHYKPSGRPLPIL